MSLFEKLFTVRNVLIVLCIWIVAALTLFGTSGLKESFWTNESPAPYVDDPAGASVAMNAMLLSDNLTSPEQCKKGSSFSSSGGCVILTDQQKQLINTRGGNRTSESSSNSF